MYIKFCRNYGEDKKDEAKENLSSKLSVELEGERGKQTEGNTRLYRAGCLFLTLICLILLLVIIILSVKLQTGSTDCPGRGTSSVATCKYEQCLADFPKVEPDLVGCKRCADGWLEFEGSCFYLSTTRLNWRQSQSNCSARGGSLAVISSQKFQSFLTEKGEKRGYWIGLRRNENQWSWINNTPLQESYWIDDRQPGDCGFLKTSRPHQKNWMKWSCASTTYFICELQILFHVQA
ncbi:early activation antigen CD69 isoform X2 [Paralichthys olivaceus]|uniref:early activation antigen CD69 isoform X2 n=1 Tax=Paralichthys olivaceus TaxID=8255 RepID=UPI0037534054